MTWRLISQRTIQSVIDRVGTADKGLLKRELFAAYPFGERTHYPYKVWCEEVRKVLRPDFKPMPTENLFGIVEK